MTGKIRDMTTDRAGKTVLMLEINERQAAEAMYDELNLCEKLDISVKKHREKRSLDANAYCWVLLGKLAAKLNIAPEVIYREMIRDIGENYEVLPIKADAAAKFCEVWGGNGIGWMTSTFPSKLHGYVNVMAYYGSSTYDKAQMTRLIDNIVQECRVQGIEVRPAEEIESMMKYWEDRTR